jgi:hypothetical protein
MKARVLSARQAVRFVTPVAKGWKVRIRGNIMSTRNERPASWWWVSIRPLDSSGRSLFHV